MAEAGAVVSRQELAQMQSLPLQAKIIKSLHRIEEWLNYWYGLAYVSYSGGKDSEVLLWLARQVDSSIPAVFLNTRMEYPEIVRHVREHGNVTTIFPSVTPLQVIQRHGYPVVSKQVSRYVRELRNPLISEKRKAQLLHVGKDRTKMQYRLSYKWRFLLDAPFKIDDVCCKYLKHYPVQKYERRTKRKPIVGTKASDSSQRYSSYLNTGCNFISQYRSISSPISFWTDQDVLECIRHKNLPLCPVYGEIIEEDGKLKCSGVGSTGCVFCSFGAHMESYPNRYQRLKESHPKLYKVCMENFGMREVLDYVGIPYE